MKEHYVSYEQAVKLKELGFDEPCEFYYNPYQELRISKDCLLSPKITNNRFLEDIADGMATAPRLDQAAAWMRDCKGWDVTSIPTLAKYGKKKYRWDVCHWSKPEYGDCSNGIFDTYEEALSAGISKAIELLGKEVNNA